MKDLVYLIFQPFIRSRLNGKTFLTVKGGSEMSFNFKLIKELQQRDSIKRADLARMLGVTSNYLYRIEKGIFQPSIKLMLKMSDVFEVPVDKLINGKSGAKPGDSNSVNNSVNALVETIKKLDHKRDELIRAEKIITEQERTIEHLRAIIELHIRFENISCKKTLSESEKTSQLEELAKNTVKENEINFHELLAILRVKRAILRKWISEEKLIYKCRYAERGEIEASTIGEAALRLRCFECDAFESEECKGHGNEKRPNNIIELIVRLEAHGIISKAEQAEIIEECYNLRMTPHEVSEIVYRDNHGLPISEDVFYLDRPRRKR
jgi:putative transcriptional regulator